MNKVLSKMWLFQKFYFIFSLVSLLFQVLLLLSWYIPHKVCQEVIILTLKIILMKLFIISYHFLQFTPWRSCIHPCQLTEIGFLTLNSFTLIWDVIGWAKSKFDLLNIRVTTRILTILLQLEKNTRVKLRYIKAYFHFH